MNFLYKSVKRLKRYSRNKYLGQVGRHLVLVGKYVSYSFIKLLTNSTNFDVILVKIGQAVEKI
jgi:hypothetical protein